MTSQENQILNSLYGNYFTQLLRVKHDPTYVQKEILDETVNIIRNYLLVFTAKIREDIKRYIDQKTNSSLVWDKQYYEKISQEKYNILDTFESTIKDTFSNDFIKKDFSKTGTAFDEVYSEWLPKSSVREIYLNYLESLSFT